MRETGLLRWLLAGSLAVNLFLVAFVGVEAWRMRHPLSSGLAEGAVESVFKQIGERLPADDRTVLRRAFAARLPALIAAGRDSRDGLDQARADIEADPFDPAKLRADLEAARTARQRAGLLVQEVLLDSLPRLSPRGRKAIADFRLIAR
jgi:uncharacterized membrane protein